MPTITQLRREKSRLRAAIRQTALDIASGRRPSPRQLLDLIVTEANTNAEIQ